MRDACECLGVTAEVIGIEASSGQNKQPIDFRETYNGALARATFVKENDPGDNVYIGIESGIINILPIHAMDIAVIIVLAGNRRIVATSAGVEFPQSCMAVACHRGFKTTTAGSVVAEKLGGDATDPHSSLTNQKVSRRDTLVQALTIALSQL